MINASFAKQLNELAVLLELQGENPFRIRAYQNAAPAHRIFSPGPGGLFRGTSFLKSTASAKYRGENRRVRQNRQAQGTGGPAQKFPAGLH